VIAIPHTVRVFLGTQPQDFRKSIDGLAAVVSSHLQRDPLTGDVFVFHNKRRTALKVLYWDHGGFCLIYKRLERGRFRVPHLHTTRREVVVSPAEFTALFEGIDLSRARRLPRWNPPLATAEESGAMG
jgi:transposase